jgi:hypothetical protein
MLIFMFNNTFKLKLREFQKYHPPNSSSGEQLLLELPTPWVLPYTENHT